MVVMLMTDVAEEAFGVYLKRLRGKERPVDLARRAGISARHVTTLEEGGSKNPEINTLLGLARAHKDDYYGGDENRAFWDLWRRAGYPLPPGYMELSDEARKLVIGWSGARRDRQEEILKALEVPDRDQSEQGMPAVPLAAIVQSR